MISMNIDIGQNDLPKLEAVMTRAQRELGKSEESTIKWTSRKLIGSLGASTRIAPELRPVVRNPHPDAKTDRRRAPFGVMYYPHGVKTFKPIFRTGKYGSTRFFDKKTVGWYTHTGPNKNTWTKVASGPQAHNPESVAPGIMTDKRRKIGRRGLAKQSWKWLGRKVTRGGSIRAMDVNQAGRITLRKSLGVFSLRIQNDLRYINEAVQGGRQQVSSSVARAASGLETQITKQVNKIAAKANA